MMNCSTRIVSVNCCRHPYVAANLLVEELAKSSTTRIQMRCYIPPAYRNTKRFVMVKPRKRVGGFVRGGRFKRFLDKVPTAIAGPLVNGSGGGDLYQKKNGVGGDDEMYESGLRRISDSEVYYLQNQKHGLLKRLHVYRQILLYNEGEEHADIPQHENTYNGSTKGEESLVEYLMTLQKQKNERSLLPATTETLVQSEELFRSICCLLQDMILKWAQQASHPNDSFSTSKLRYLFGEDPQSVAEELLLALVEIRNDRASLVKAAAAAAAAAAEVNKTQEPIRKATTSVIKNIGAWVGKFLGLPPKQEEGEDSNVNNKEENIELIAHSNPHFGPQSDHLGAVLHNMALQVQGLEANGKDEKSNEDSVLLLKHAERMTLILEQSTTDNVVTLDPGILEFVLQTWVKVGTAHAGQEAERLYLKYDAGSKEWNSNLLLVLQALRNAAAMTRESNETRRDVVLRARKFVTKKLKTSSRLLPPTQERLRTQSFITLLESYQQAGIDAIPHMGDQARELMILRVDTKSLNQLEGRDKVLLLATRILRPNYVPDLDLLDALILTYAMTNQRNYIIRAVQLLKIVLHSRQRTPWCRVVPTAPCIDKVVYSLCHLERTSQDASEMQMALFGLRMIDVLYTTDHQLPLPSTFTSIFQLLETSQSPDAAETAEELLSRMELRAALEKNTSNNNYNANHHPWINRTVYHSVLRCWRKAAGVHLGAAARAWKLLETMEAQSSPYPPSFALAPAVQEIVANVYNDAVKPDEETYLLVLQTCFNTQKESDKEEALKIAYKVFYQMSQRGINPSENVRNTMLNGCKLLLPDDPQKCDALVQDIKRSLEIAA